MERDVRSAWKPRKRAGWRSAELSDTSEARFCDCAVERGARRGGSILPTKDSAQRNAAKAQGASARGAGARPTPPRVRRVPEVPCAARFGAAAEHTEGGCGELRRTRPRRRICIRRAGRWTRKSTNMHRAPGCHETGRTLEGNSGKWGMGKRE